MEDIRWKLIWESKLQPRIKHFIWLARRGQLLTNCERVRRRMDDSEHCDRCGMLQESLIHVLCDCPLATVVWMLQGNISVQHKFFEMEFEDWFLTNLKGQSWMGTSGAEVTVKFGVLIWL